MNSSVFNKISLYLQSKQVVPGVVVAVDTPKLSRTYVWGRHSGLDSPHVSANTIFDLASISKLYTCLYALKLCDKGILNLAAKCSEYLDVFHRSNLTLMDLLTHRANFNVRLADYRLNHPNDLAYHIFNIIPPKEAENNVFYENITYLYVGKIIESVTGKSLGENLKSMLAEYTFSQTFLGSELDKHKIIAPPTEQFGNLLIENITHDETARMLGGIAGNAGIFASANDLIKFGKIWLHNNGFLT